MNATGRPQAAYSYHGQDGAELYQVLRYAMPDGSKSFRQRRLDGNSGYVWGLGETERVPYRLPQLLSAKTVFICEGEKDADNLASRLGLAATCNMGGAGNFKPELAKWFRGKHVVVLPDNDEPGRKHAESVGNALAAVAASVKVVNLPGLPEKGDVTDWLMAGGTIEQLRRLYTEAPIFVPEERPKPKPTRRPPRTSSNWSNETERLKAAADIVGVISQYVKLVKTGPQWKGPCPFHKDGDPSLAVSRDKQAWYCHGCREGGDVLSFVRRIEDTTFLGAKRILVNLVNLDLGETAWR